VLQCNATTADPLIALGTALLHLRHQLPADVALTAQFVEPRRFP
jgi:hypothetical protein